MNNCKVCNGGPNGHTLSCASLNLDGSVIEHFDYVAEAHLTLSPQFHGELVGRELFDIQLNMAINALAALDKIKKTLFYGKDNNLKGELGHENCYGLIGHMINPVSFSGGPNCTKEEAVNLIHGIIGMATEAGEMLELLRHTLEGVPLDKANLVEEVGDSKWYMAILARVGGFMWGDDERKNIAKLRARFPDRFTEYDANNRNLAAERVILEGDAASQLHLPINERSTRMPGELNKDASDYTGFGGYEGAGWTHPNYKPSK